MSREFGPSRPEQVYEKAMAKAQESVDNGGMVGAREWLEVAQQARRLMEMERLSNLGRGAEFLRNEEAIR